MDAVKLKMTYKETQGSPALASTGTIWVEKSSGDTIQADLQLENVPLGGGPPGGVASGKMHVERIAGGPLGGPKGPDGKPLPPKQKTIDEIVKEYEKLPGLFTLYRKREAGRETVLPGAARGPAREAVLPPGDGQHRHRDDRHGRRPAAGYPLQVLRERQRADPDGHPEHPVRGLGQLPSRAVRQALLRTRVPGGVQDRGAPAGAQEPPHQYQRAVPDRHRPGRRGRWAAGRPRCRGWAAPRYSLDKEKSYLATLKAFPENLYIETAYHFTRSGGQPGGIAGLFDDSGTLADPRSVPVKVNFNLFQIPANGYRPRVADPRVGYFYTAVPGRDRRRPG